MVRAKPQSCWLSSEPKPTSRANWPIAYFGCPPTANRGGVVAPTSLLPARADWGLGLEAIQRLEAGHRHPRVGTVAVLARTLDLSEADRLVFDVAARRRAMPKLPHGSLVGRSECMTRVVSLLSQERFVMVT